MSYRKILTFQALVELDVLCFRGKEHMLNIKRLLTKFIALTARQAIEKDAEGRNANIFISQIIIKA